MRSPPRHPGSESVLSRGRTASGSGPPSAGPGGVESPGGNRARRADRAIGSAFARDGGFRARTGWTRARAVVECTHRCLRSVETPPRRTRIRSRRPRPRVVGRAGTHRSGRPATSPREAAWAQQRTGGTRRHTTCRSHTRTVVECSGRDRPGYRRVDVVRLGPAFSVQNSCCFSNHNNSTGFARRRSHPRFSRFSPSWLRVSLLIE
jgi:hypothetical protein